jgi:hypothetical protein
MSQPGVSKLMDRYGPAESTEQVVFTEGADGKKYFRAPRKSKEEREREEPTAWNEPKAPREQVHPWAPGGDVGKALRKMWAATSGWSPDVVRGELTDRQWSETRQLIHELIDAATRWVQQPSE